MSKFWRPTFLRAPPSACGAVRAHMCTFFLFAFFRAPQVKCTIALLLGADSQPTLDTAPFFLLLLVDSGRYYDAFYGMGKKDTFCQMNADSDSNSFIFGFTINVDLLFWVCWLSSLACPPAQPSASSQASPFANKPMISL